MEILIDREERLDKYLAQMLPEVSRSKLVSLIQDGSITVDGLARKPSFKVEPGMNVQVGEILDTPAHDLTPVQMDLVIVYEDDDLVVIDKPRGVATHPAPGLKEATLVNALLGRSGPLSSGSAEFRPGIVHRLDKETTGLLVVAKTDRSHADLAGQIAAKTAERRYVGLAYGRFASERHRVEAPIGRDTKDRRKMKVDPRGKDAVTHLKVLATVEGNTLSAARLETGRTHQIRVHCVSTGHPIKGDIIYSRGDWSYGPLQLHAAYLSFIHPTKKEEVAFYAPPPPDFKYESLIEEEHLLDW